MRKELGPATVALLIVAWAMGGIEQENAMRRAAAAAVAAESAPLGGPDVERPDRTVPAGSPSADSNTPDTPLLALEKGESIPADSSPTDSGGAAAPPESPIIHPETVAPDASKFVHRMTVRANGTAGVGSATHIGNGVYLTCKHLFARPWTSIDIDADPVVATNVTYVTTMDFAIVRTQKNDSPAAETFTGELPDGQALTVVGAKTGAHAGHLSTTRYTEGYRNVEATADSTESGDSGAGVFDEQGRLVGVHWGSFDGKIVFTPLARVRHLIDGSAPQAASQASSPASASSSGHWETRCENGRCRNVWVPN